MKTLYKKDSKNKIRVWNIYTEDNLLVQESGILGGKLVCNRRPCIEKNIGKTNATTPIQQALLELESEYKSKLDEGYFETEEQAKNEEVILPMLAKSYEDEKHKIDWKNCYLQPKLDGMRCLAHVKSNGDVTLISRDGKIITNMEHIMDDLSTIRQDIILDGELYSHGISFQENMKLIKKYRPGQTEKVKYHIYDVVSDNNYITRQNMINSIRWINCLNIEIVHTAPCNSEEWLKNGHQVNIFNGYEGSILRQGLAPYKVNGRSSNLLKYKNFKDIDAVIIDILPSSARPEQGVPLLEYMDKNTGKSVTFSAGVKMNHADREDLLTNKAKYIHKIANIRFFEWTDDNIPRFPVMVGIHEDR